MSISNPTADQRFFIQPLSFRRRLVSHPSVLVGVNGALGGGSIDHGDSGTATVVFEVPDTARPAALRWEVVVYIDLPRRGETIEWTLR